MLLIKFPVGIRNQLFTTYNINFYYPSVFNNVNIVAQNRMNFAVYENMRRLSLDLIVPDIPTYIDGSFEIKNNQKGVLSLSLIGLGDFRGAHPMTIINSLNFDIDTGKNYKLGELFKPDSNYIEVLSRMVLEQLEIQEIPLFDDYPGISSNQDYYIADKSLIIYFQLYEIAPYYVGFPYAIIPIYAIQDIIIEGGLLSKMLSA
ncbi:DUF3298 domain-containing protein [Alkalibaculum sp. M08DMB]|uniref:DUF3298 domain-containing protein n=1 Tax=Alkalibaculum sporogenes TaxID=2655001 RepID=A0A6A7KA36_9FIRM|nr:RsiV family protein [Alkalibaculum sporogenes]MPW26225.1 DUF3298 domain-containing protein [Alkalibaculum sporogenes]